MADKNVQDYLDKGLSGTPQLKPEEKKKYLGTFRERIYLTMTFSEIQHSQAAAALTTELAQHPEGQLLLSGALDAPWLDQFVQLARGKNLHFTLVNTYEETSAEQIALVYAADYAVDLPTVAVSQKYADLFAQSTPTTTTDKPSFFQRLFYGDESSK